MVNLLKAVDTYKTTYTNSPLSFKIVPDQVRADMH